MNAKSAASGASSEHEDDGAGGIVVAREVYPDRLPILALPVRPVFPKVMIPLELDTEELQDVVRYAQREGSGLVGLVLERETAGAEKFDGMPHAARTVVGDFYEVGVVAQVVNVAPSEDEELTALLSVLDRMRIVRVVKRSPYLIADVEYLEDVAAPSDELKAYTLAVINLIKDLVALNPLYKEQLSLLLNEGNLEEPGPLADMAAFLTSAPGSALQGILELLDVRRRLEKVLGLLKHELEISQLQTKIREKIEDRINDQQREFFLREQLKAIKQELGIEKEGKDAELEEFEERLGTRKLSEQAKHRVEEELKKLRMLEPSSAEYNITRNYLDWLTVLPWGMAQEESVDLRRARRILERDHFGLKDVKERIIEFVAEGILRGHFGGSIICLVGPPGVGKTSVGRSIAESLGRKFFRFSLGGVKDEAEIKGHRRTYIGAMPGKFIQALRVTGTENPVIMLDEIDKMGSSYHGDPASALLEVLDPEQNSDFLDHYLDVRFDLSKVMFVCTANQLDTIPDPLLDRMEVIRLSGYILEDKLEIAERFLVPRALKPLKLKPGRIRVTRDALRELIDGYAREAGLRNLDNQIKKIVRKSAVRVVEKRTPRIKIGPAQIQQLLGRRVFTEESALSAPRVGVVRGLAWTNMGGDTLFIEARAIPAKTPSLKQTGQLGSVMVESTEIAYTVLRAFCQSDDPARLGFFERHAVHLHVPAGAVPKDGPSAGVTMATALFSLAFGIALKPGFAMTGELNLSGCVMPVGGIREKIIAAKRAGVRHVILPGENASDYEHLEPKVRRGIQVHFVTDFREVLHLCLPSRGAWRRCSGLIVG